MRYGVKTNKSIKRNPEGGPTFHSYRDRVDPDSIKEEVTTLPQKVELCHLCRDKKRMLKELHERNRQLAVTLKKSGYSEDFKYNPDDSCPTCLALRMVKVQVSDKREVVDKGERKRMRRLHGEEDDEEVKMEEVPKIVEVSFYDNSKLDR